MASIRREISIDVRPDLVWSAMRDVAALHTRPVAGFLADCRLGGDARMVTFANGIVARKLIVDVDDGQRRIAWAAVGGRLTHHNASPQVFDAGVGTRVVWIADMLAHELAPAIAPMIEQGLAAMKRTLEGARSSA